MNGILKQTLANVYDLFGISDLNLKKLNKKYNNNYVRVINYHHTLKTDAENFENQIKWLKDRFDNMTYGQFDTFMKTGEKTGEKPAIILTFDDGFEDNYTVAKPILEKYGFTGFFMVSSERIGKAGYMDSAQLKDLAANGHTITCHTATHYRMTPGDDDTMLNYQIVVSKIKIEAVVGNPINVFTWVGGEEEFYTKKAQEMIKKAGYSYGFMTNSAPVLKDTDPFLVQRTNIESNWNIKRVKLSLCGFMDKKYKAKRDRIEAIMK